MQLEAVRKTLSPDLSHPENDVMSRAPVCYCGRFPYDARNGN